MAEVDNLTMLAAIQAVHAEIRRYEQLLTSEILKDREEIENLIFSYEKAAESLRESYQKAWKPGTNLPAYNEFMKLLQAGHT